MAEKVTKKRVAFQFEAPNAREVYLIGTFSGWNLNAHPMKKNKEGVWKTMVNLIPGTYEYLFLVDGEYAEDPHAKISKPNEYNGHDSVLIVQED